MSNVVPFNASAVPAHIRGDASLPDMNAAAQAGVHESMAVVSFKGKNWSFKFRGESKLHVDGRGAPDPFFDVIIVGVADNVSKIYYEKSYNEGDNEAPDCWSTNGITPDPHAKAKQHTTCNGCPMAEWGSRMTNNGSKAKACSDSKRLAVVPFGDVDNAAYGGPMMLRLPATTLQTFSQYCRQLQQGGAQPVQVVTRLTFDPNFAYPKITFQPVGWIQEQAVYDRAKEWSTSDQVQRILKMSEAPAQAPAPAVNLLANRPAFAQIPAPAAPTTVVAPPAPPAAPVVDEMAALKAKLAALEAAAAQTQATVTQSLTKIEGAPIPINPPAPAAAPAPVAEEVALEGEVLAPQPAAVQPAPTDMESEIAALIAGI